MPQDPTFTATLINMIVSGYQMNSGMFTLMGKGTPEILANEEGVVVSVSDGTYTATISYAEPLAKAEPHQDQ